MITRFILFTLLRPFVVGIWYLTGWRMENPFPSDIPKYVTLGVPHTSNWDYWQFVCMAFYSKRRPKVTIKDSFFVGPLGWFLKMTGGIPINRSKSQNLVEQLTKRFNNSERMVLVFTPEGTRSASDHWRTGFYYTALSANVPIVPAYIDYRRKRAGAGEPIVPTGDLQADFEKIKAFYSDYGYPKHPDRMSKLALPPDKVTSPNSAPQ